MIDSRRSVFDRMTFGHKDHPGLWLDKFLPEQLRRDESPPADKDTPQMAHFKSAAGIEEPSFYQRSFDRWQRVLQQLDARMEKGEVLGRMVVGLGANSVLENAISLHHTYGLPFIPGSALKGLASSYAHLRLENAAWNKGGEAHRILFGDTTSAGYVTFFDALYIPKSAKRGFLWPDVITVHHRDYYQKEGVAPADWDSPTIIPFISATGKYLIALAGPEAWVGKAFEILGLALLEFGVGAKTSSGYGRVKIAGPKPSQDIVKTFLKRWNAVPTSKLPQTTNSFFEEWKRLEGVSNADKATIARMILERIRNDAPKFEKKKREKAWYKELLTFTETHQED